ncbi:hypothetical protein T10_7976 [Trichinella papuae]|uniref:Uncharacterized protein n=1 Tax=Trichinella papuae TaxID=268474 RepID=A0A0V1M582_9BILA|nr:hypothetical protein T10_7976 [Trichinella papuae]
MKLPFLVLEFVHAGRFWQLPAHLVPPIFVNPRVLFGHFHVQRQFEFRMDLVVYKSIRLEATCSMYKILTRCAFCEGTVGQSRDSDSQVGHCTCFFPKQRCSKEGKVEEHVQNENSDCYQIEIVSVTSCCVSRRSRLLQISFLPFLLFLR